MQRNILPLGKVKEIVIPVYEVWASAGRAGPEHKGTWVEDQGGGFVRTRLRAGGTLLMLREVMLKRAHQEFSKYSQEKVPATNTH